MRIFRTLILIGFTEILIGVPTLFVTILTLVAGINQKPQNVLIFVLIAAATSTSLGLGILKLKRWAYQLLLYFSSVIILSKFLIFLDILQLNGALETTVPSPGKNAISILYHGFIIFYLKKSDVKKYFYKV